GQRVGRAQPHFAATLGVDQRRQDGEALAQIDQVQLVLVLVGDRIAPGQGVDLQVRDVFREGGFDEADRLEEGAAKPGTAGPQLFPDDPGGEVGRGAAVDRVLGEVRHRYEQVVVQ